MVAVIPVL